MQRVRHLGGVQRAEVLRDPNSVFDGVASAVTIGFGPRIKGIGDFPFVARPYLQGSSSGIFDDPERTEHGAPRKLKAGVKCRYEDGSEEDVSLIPERSYCVFTMTQEMPRFTAKASSI